MAEQRLFLSLVSDEFEKPAARYPGFRSALAAYLRRAGCHVEVQVDVQQEGAVDTVEKLADRSEDAEGMMAARATATDALHQRGDHAAARALVQETERMWKDAFPTHIEMGSLWGFRYCDLLLAEAERAVWNELNARAQRRREFFAASRLCV